MELQLTREDLLKPLQLVAGVVEKRQTLPILSNVLLQITDENTLKVMGTDLEVELESYVPLSSPAKAIGDITVPGRKLMDICKTLPEAANVMLSVEKEKVLIKSGRSRFSLSTLPAKDFPSAEKSTNAIQFTISQQLLKFLLQRTYFAMAQQDVRYYLNGMLIELGEGMLRTVATDGHRLAMNEVASPTISTETKQVIVPYKGILELIRLLQDNDQPVTVSLGSHLIQVSGPHFGFTSKLMDGSYPDYKRVLPKGGDKTVLADRDALKQALTRAAILSNEKFRGISLQLAANSAKIYANNPEQEEAEDEISLHYTGPALNISFNVAYLLDVLNIARSGQIKITLTDANSSILLEEDGEAQPHDCNSLFVVMPMRI